MCAINDPLGQTHSLSSSDAISIYSHLKVVLFCELLKSKDGRTTRAKIVITTSRDGWWSSWINFAFNIEILYALQIGIDNVC